MDAFPTGLSLLDVDPTEVLDDLLVFVDTSQDEKIFAQHAGCVVFAGFGKIA